MHSKALFYAFSLRRVIKIYVALMRFIVSAQKGEREGDMEMHFFHSFSMNILHSLCFKKTQPYEKKSRNMWLQGLSMLRL